MKKSAVWEMIEKESAKGYPGSAWRPVYLNTSWLILQGSAKGISPGLSPGNTARASTCYQRSETL